MNRISRILTMITAAAMAVCAANSCQFRPLEDPDNSLSIAVAVNIKAIANVTCDIYNEKVSIPAVNTDMMHVMFFDPETNEVAAESYISDVDTVYDETGKAERVLKGDISVRPGKYKMIIYNFDTESTLIRNQEDYNTIEAYTDQVPVSISTRYANAASALNNSSSASTKADVSTDLNMVFEPDHLVVAKNTDEEIPYHTGLYTVNAEAKSIVESYYLQIRVDGLQYVSSAQAVLSGMVYSNFIGQDEGKTPGATLYFTLEKSQSARDDNADVLCCVFNTFGRIDGSTNQLYVTFDVKTTYGTEKTYTFEISNKFLSDDCINHHWLLLSDKITVDAPPAGTSGGGFDPVVNDWDHEEHTVNF